MAAGTARGAQQRRGRGGHRLYRILLPIPIVCFVATLAADLAYVAYPDMLWLDFASWLLLAGLVAGGFTGLVLIIEMIRIGRRGTRALGAHFVLLLSAWIVEVLNAFIHARDGWTAVVPLGLGLSILAVVLSLVAGWCWQSFAHAEAGETL